MAERMSASELRDDAADVLNRVAYRGERIILHRRGKDVAAIVPMEDLALLEELEDRRDAEAAEQAYREFREKGEPAATLEEVARELGIALPDVTR